MDNLTIIRIEICKNRVGQLVGAGVTANYLEEKKMKLMTCFLTAAFLATACQVKTSDLSGKKEKSGGTDYSKSEAARSVHALEKGRGVLDCAGVDSKLNFVRTRATIDSGKLEALVVEAFANKENPSQVPNQLTPDLEKYRLFSHDVSKRMIDLEMDLKGSKFDIEVFADMNGKSREIYDLEIRAENDGEGASTLNAYLSYKDPTVGIDTSEIIMGCFVKLDK